MEKIIITIMVLGLATMFLLPGLLTKYPKFARLLGIKDIEPEFNEREYHQQLICRCLEQEEELTKQQDKLSDMAPSTNRDRLMRQMENAKDELAQARTISQMMLEGYEDLHPHPSKEVHPRFPTHFPQL